jgi:hypothetical protein
MARTRAPGRPSTARLPGMSTAAPKHHSAQPVPQEERKLSGHREGQAQVRQEFLDRAPPAHSGLNRLQGGTDLILVKAEEALLVSPNLVDVDMIVARLLVGAKAFQVALDV